MLVRRGICRPSQEEVHELERLRGIVREAREVLIRVPVPDTFLGRKTQEPFSWEAQMIVRKIPDDSHR
jgi:hypothetical protein